MKMIKKILIALDSSSSALNATNYAIKLTKELKAKLEIVSIINYAMGNIDAGILPQDIEKKNKLHIKELITKIKEKHSKLVIRDFETIGVPEKEIIKIIKEWEADLLILGHHTHSFIETLFIKSVEKKLINHIKCPILIIPEKNNNK